MTIAAITVAVTGCVFSPEPEANDSYVWNYSTSEYVVRVVDTAGANYDFTTPPTSWVHGFLKASPPKRVLVFDLSCAAKLADLTVPQGAHVADLVIDATGAMSISATYQGPATGAYENLAVPDPLPTGCSARMDGSNASSP
jgi:hypothetical protein